MSRSHVRRLSLPRRSRGQQRGGLAHGRVLERQRPAAHPTPPPKTGRVALDQLAQAMQHRIGLGAAGGTSGAEQERRRHPRARREAPKADLGRHQHGGVARQSGRHQAVEPRVLFAPRQQALEKATPLSAARPPASARRCWRRAARHPPRIEREARRPRRCTTSKAARIDRPMPPTPGSAARAWPASTMLGSTSAPKNTSPGASGALSWKTREKRAAAPNSATRLATTSGPPGSESYSNVRNRAATSSGGGTPGGFDRYCGCAAEDPRERRR